MAPHNAKLDHVMRRIRPLQDQPLAIVACLMLAACSGDFARPPHPDGGGRPAGAKLTRGDALDLGRNAAWNAGYLLSRYHVPEIYYEPRDGKPTWIVFFNGIAELPGNHFIVLLDDQTRVATVVPGE